MQLKEGQHWPWECKAPHPISSFFFLGDVISQQPAPASMSSMPSLHERLLSIEAINPNKAFLLALVTEF